MDQIFRNPGFRLGEYDVQPQEDISESTEEIFRSLIMKGNGGCKVISLAAPALSTEFVKSKFQSRAQVNCEGSLAEIILPSVSAIRSNLDRKHGEDLQFDMKSTESSDAFPAGYGERSAKALAREENTFQLKGAFPAAALSLAKLRARVESRNGDVACVDKIFSKLWGLSESQVSLLPQMHIDGNESTRMAAMEDRAYHALSGHPAHNGGFRVDMATLAPDALGENIPLNWSRLRTGLKAVGVVQNQGDVEMMDVREKLPKTADLPLTMDLVQGSQPVYTRPRPWEKIVNRLMEVDPVDEYQVDREMELTDVGRGLMKTYDDVYIAGIVGQSDLRIKSKALKIASMVKQEANRSLLKTIEVIHMHDQDREMLIVEEEDEFELAKSSKFTKVFTIPRYKVTRDSLRLGLERKDIGRDNLPDLLSHGRMPLSLNMGEFRESQLNVPVDIPGALNMATYVTMSRASMAAIGYRLLQTVKDPDPGGRGTVASRLRKKSLYQSQDVKALGVLILNDYFMSVFETIFRNITLTSNKREHSVRDEVWDYLCRRDGKHKVCPVRGGWRDLIAYLRDAEQGWTLYYWARVSIGKLQFAMSNSILAPIAAGDEVDFLTLIRKGVNERASRWASYYANEYESMVMQYRMNKREMEMIEENSRTDSENVKRYIPPHLRERAHLERVYDEDKYQYRQGGFSKEQYERMVEMQVKAKFFSQVEANSFDRRISVGITDRQMREAFVESYQARWLSIERRLESCRRENRPFKLGPHFFEEHPWGELVTDFPETIDEMLTFSMSLDSRAWTIDPMFIWNKFDKSISELWSDVLHEISLISAYIDETQDCMADEQVRVDTERKLSSVMASLAGVAPIAIPAHGYRAPHKLPERQIQLETPTGVRSVQYDSQSFVSGSVLSGENEDDDDDMGELEMTEGTASIDLSLITSFGRIGQGELETQGERYLTYNEIWHELDLPQEIDDRKRAAYGLASDANLDQPHLDATIGPVLTYEERMRTRQAWDYKMNLMQKRLGIAVKLVFGDDM